MALFWDAAPRIPSGLLTLAAGQVFVPQQGWYWLRGSKQSSVQRYDPIAELWRPTGHDTDDDRFLYFDGITTRIANTTGCVVAAIVTTAGSGYTSAPTVTLGAGSATALAIVGGCLSTAAVIGAAGSGYQYPPLIWIESPPQPGIQATAYATISSGTISAVTIDNQGAGYLAPPNVVVLNDARDTVGGGGAVSLAITGAQTVTGVIITNHGNPITSGTVPAITFAGGGGNSAAATAIMDWCITSTSISAAGAGYTGAATGAITATGAGGYVTATPAYLGGSTSVSSQRYWQAVIDISTNSSGGLNTVLATIDPGRYQGVPTPQIMSQQQYSTVGTLVFTMGGLQGTIFLVPAQQ